MKHHTIPGLLTLGAAVCAAASLAAQPDPIPIPGPTTPPTSLPLRLECGDFWANQRHNALVLMDNGTLWLSYHTAVHATISQVGLDGFVATDVVCVANSTGDKFLVTGNGLALAGSFPTNGTVQLQPVLDVTWVGATGLRARVSSSGVRWIAGIQAGTGGTSICVAYAQPGQALSALTPIQLLEAALAMTLADYVAGDAPEVVAVTANAIRVYQPTGASVATVTWSAADPWVVALDGTTIGSAVAVVDSVGGSYQATVLNAGGSLLEPLDTSGLGLEEELDVTGVAAVDADGDRLDDDLLVTHAQGDTALRVADPGAGAVQTALSLTIPVLPGSDPCVDNFDEDENDDFVALNASAPGLVIYPDFESLQVIEPVDSIYAAEYLSEDDEELQLKLTKSVVDEFAEVEVRVWHQDNPFVVPVPGLESPPVADLTLAIGSLQEENFEGTQVLLLNIPNIKGTNSQPTPDIWPEHDHYWIELRFKTAGGDASPVEMEGMTMANVEDALPQGPNTHWDDYLEEFESMTSKTISTGRPGVFGMILIRVPHPPQFTDPPPDQG